MCGSDSGGPTGGSLCGSFQMVYIPIIEIDGKWLKPERKTWVEAQEICNFYGKQINKDLALYTIPHEDEPDADGWWSDDVENFWKDRVKDLKNKN